MDSTAGSSIFGQKNENKVASSKNLFGGATQSAAITSTATMYSEGSDKAKLFKKYSAHDHLMQGNSDTGSREKHLDTEIESTKQLFDKTKEPCTSTSISAPETDIQYIESTIVVPSAMPGIRTATDDSKFLFGTRSADAALVEKKHERMVPQPVFGSKVSSPSPEFTTSTGTSSSLFGAKSDNSLPPLGTTTIFPAPVFGSKTDVSTQLFGTSTNNSGSVYGLTTDSSASVLGSKTDDSSTVCGINNSSVVLGTKPDNSAVLSGPKTNVATPLLVTTTEKTSVIGGESGSSVSVIGTKADSSVSATKTNRVVAAFETNADTGTPKFGTKTSNSVSLFGTNAETAVPAVRTKTANATTIFENKNYSSTSLFGASAAKFTSKSEPKSETASQIFGIKSNSSIPASGSTTDSVALFKRASSASPFGGHTGSSIAGPIVQSVATPSVSTISYTTGNMTDIYTLASDSKTYTSSALSDNKTNVSNAPVAVFGGVLNQPTPVFRTKLSSTTVTTSTSVLANKPIFSLTGNKSDHTVTKSEAISTERPVASCGGNSSHVSTSSFVSKSDTIMPQLVFRAKTDTTTSLQQSELPKATVSSSKSTFITSVFTKTADAPIVFGSKTERSFGSPPPNVFSKESKSNLSNKFGAGTVSKSGSNDIYKRPFSPDNSATLSSKRTATQSLFGARLKTDTEINSRKREHTGDNKYDASESPSKVEMMSDEDIFDIATFEEGADDKKVEKVEPTSLVAVDVDEKYLNRSILTAHFMKFGLVTKVLINKKSNQASIYFNDHNSAAKAKVKGKILHPKIPEMKLFYGAISDKNKTIAVTRKRVEPASSSSSSIRAVHSLPFKKQVTERDIISYADIEAFPHSKPSVSPIKSVKPKMLTTKRVSTHQKFAEPIRRDKSAVTIEPSRSTITKALDLIKPGYAASDRAVKSPPCEVPVFKSSKSSETVPIKSNSEGFIDSKRKIDIRSKAPSGNMTAIKDNSVLMKQQAYNNYDRYLILDARDKILRIKQRKIHDVTRAQYLLATCPDMCPEKERYSRDIQYDLSVFELTDGELNHKVIVKKFSRSSADKDEPLPHELRPGPVLKMTMDYLVCSIIDNEKVSGLQLDVWYNYLCNRTRALRNDIMTQHLVDENAVYVLEKITRFHIHCSHHLCEEPSDLFDSKMNAEHLTKSLQSLKELYHDLSEKDVYFVTECEFRAYEMLLDANDGNVIIKYLNFRDPVRNSGDVQFAMKVVRAIQTNNFMKFFKLLAAASYMQSCLMHRHFLSMRIKALKVITKAYSFPKEVQALPSSRLMNMLGFSDESKFQIFLRYFGLIIDVGSKINIGSRSFTFDVENIPPVLKSIDLVDAKKHNSTGFIIQGGPLPQNPLTYCTPHDSFDEAGYLKQEAYDAKDQRTSVVVSTRDAEPVSNTDGLRETDENRETKKELMRKVDFMYQLTLMKKYFKIWRNFADEERTRKLITLVTHRVRVSRVKRAVKRWRQYAAMVAQQKQKINNFVMRKYFQKLKMHSFVAKRNRTLREQVQNLLDKIVATRAVSIWRKKVEEMRRRKAIMSLRRRIIARKFLIHWRLLTILSSLEKRVDLYYRSKLLKTSLCRWKEWLVKRKRSREVNYETFPAFGSQLSATEQNKLWSWGYKRESHINMSVSQLSKIDEDICESSKKHLSLQKLSGLIAWSTLPLIQRCQSDIDSQKLQKYTNNYHPPFKILILVESSTDVYLLEWVRTKFNFLEIDDLTEPLSNRTNLRSCQNGATYSIIVKEQDWNCCLEDEAEASLIIIISNETVSDTSQLRVSCLDSVPFLVLCRTWERSYCEDNIWYFNKEAIDDPLTSKKLFYKIYNCWKEQHDDVVIRKSSLRTLVSGFISSHVVGPVFQTISKRMNDNPSFVSPSTFIAFYNDALSHIALCLEKSRKLKGISRNDWNDEKVNDAIMCIKGTLLPSFDPSSLLECERGYDQLNDYLRTVVSRNDWSGHLCSEVRRITKSSLRKHYQSSDVEEKENMDLCSIRSSDIPWLDIISCCILHKISYVSEIEVFYYGNIMENYDSQSWIAKVKLSEIENARKLSLVSLEDVNKETELLPSTVPIATKRQQKQVTSKFLEDLRKEKEQYTALEQRYDCQDIENELKLLKERYKVE